MFCNESRDCCCRGKISCTAVVAAILGALFTFVIGIIVGAFFAQTFLANIAAIAVLAAVLFVLILIGAILYFCRRPCD